MKTEPINSPGWARMRKRLGDKAAEALRRDTLRMQAEAMDNIMRERRAGTAHLSRDGAKPKKHTDYPEAKK